VSYNLSRRCLTDRSYKWLLVSYKLSRRCLTNRFYKWLLVSYKLSRRCLADRFYKWLLVSYGLSRRCLTLATNKLGGHTQISHSLQNLVLGGHIKISHPRLQIATARSKNRIKELSVRNPGFLGQRNFSYS
jgi:hypothetical protein